MQEAGYRCGGVGVAGCPVRRKQAKWWWCVCNVRQKALVVRVRPSVYIHDVRRLCFVARTQLRIGKGQVPQRKCVRAEVAWGVS